MKKVEKGDQRILHIKITKEQHRWLQLKRLRTGNYRGAIVRELITKQMEAEGYVWDGK